MTEYTDYKTLYYFLFNQISDTIVQLQEIQKRAENMYLSMEDKPILTILEHNQQK